MVLNRGLKSTVRAKMTKIGGIPRIFGGGMMSAIYNKKKGVSPY